MDPADMRISYERDRLDEAQAETDPVGQFARWFDEAVATPGVPGTERNAMTVATVGVDGRPSTRIVLMKGFDRAGVVFFTNYGSRKGAELAAHPVAALQFHWPDLQRVVRIEGAVQRVAAAESDAYFASRPLGSRLGAWASPQSQVMADRQELELRAEQAAARFGDEPPRPPFWGGFRVVPDRWEFWQGRPSRLHDRLRYALVDGRWVRERLAP